MGDQQNNEEYNSAVLENFAFLGANLPGPNNIIRARLRARLARELAALLDRGAGYRARLIANRLERLPDLVRVCVATVASYVPDIVAPYYTLAASTSTTTTTSSTPVVADAAIARPPAEPNNNVGS